MRDEALNPGYTEAFRCVRLLYLSAEWDGFLDRAEAFELSEEEAARIWNTRRHPALASHAVCPCQREGGGEYSQIVDAEDAALDCLFLRLGACLLAMPRCRGVCPQFLAVPRLAGEGGEEEQG